MSFAKILTILATLIFLVSCGTGKVSRISSDEVIDVSGNWNDTDSRLVSEEMINDVLSRPWLRDFELNYNKRPTIVVGQIRNLSSEHINTMTFVNDIEREMINSGKVNFVTAKDFVKLLRQERKEQDIYASATTRKEMGKEVGADLMLIGSISTIEDADNRTKVKFYQIDLRLVDIETNITKWVGQKKIKKQITGRKARL